MSELCGMFKRLFDCRAAMSIKKVGWVWRGWKRREGLARPTVRYPSKKISGSAKAVCKII